MKTQTYNTLMRIGRHSGCHQLPDRSFKMNGKQLPVCARCTGVMAGNIAALIMFFIYAIPIQTCVAGCVAMFIDWLIQYINVRQSTNIRRLITGIIGGYSLTTLYCEATKCTLQFLNIL